LDPWETVRLLILHNEATYFAGAEKMLGYYLEGLRGAGWDVSAACVGGARVREVIPATVRCLELPENQRFSPVKLAGQVGAVLKHRRNFPFDLIHAWTARDWELASVVSRISSRPAVGTLHDHPRAGFISARRQWLMRWCARMGLRRVICVSDAVREACRNAGYPVASLTTIHNGLPSAAPTARQESGAAVRIGFLGTFSERKGLRGLFATLDALDRAGSTGWEAFVAGGAQDGDGQNLLDWIRSHYSQRSWWPRIHWVGWVAGPASFLASIDLLMVPSPEFDPFPTVLLEAGQAGVPVVASKVGGVAEIVEDGVTGLLFEPGRWDLAAELARGLLESAAHRNALGIRAFERVSARFSVAKMVANHRALYSTLGI